MAEGAEVPGSGGSGGGGGGGGGGAAAAVVTEDVDPVTLDMGGLLGDENEEEISNRETPANDLYDVDYLVNFEKVGRGFKYLVCWSGEEPATGEPWEHSWESTTSLTRSTNTMDPRLWEQLLENLAEELGVERGKVGAQSRLKIGGRSSSISGGSSSDSSSSNNTDEADEKEGGGNSSGEEVGSDTNSSVGEKDEPVSEEAEDDDVTYEFAVPRGDGKAAKRRRSSRGISSATEPQPSLSDTNE
jgi:hypothetical protein